MPGMMTGAILGGSSVQQAAKLQMIIMFLISASTVLASICSSGYAISIVVDQHHRIRQDRIYSKPLYSVSLSPNWVVSVMRGVRDMIRDGAGFLWRTKLGRGEDIGARSRSGTRDERAELLGDPLSPLSPNVR